MSKNDKFTYILMPITNVQMALKYTPVCLFKCFFYEIQSYMILGPEHGNIGLIQSS